ncbi:putative hydrolase [Rhodococcus wratislaviensis NBRC 100605]|uniref:Putative hydrolase n=2 Tax=Rhodococcus wratislaviensis TaxID=44752 RepID=X0Q4R2_RHOWR|nr:putative hydrolase [Rhodococcus wratislaviensis NBRC 100605]
MEATMQPATLVPVTTGVQLNVSQTGTGEPLLLIMGTSGSLGLWEPLVAPFADHHRVIAFDNRGLGQSQRGDGPITVLSLAADAAALLAALEIERAHVLGWSLGSAVAQELALAHPDRVGGLVLYATWGRTDGFMRAMLTALGHPWATGDMEAALTALGLAFSPELLNSPDLESMMEQFRPLFPQTETQIRTTAEQWHADEGHDTLDRLAGIAAPTLVIAGEQDILTPPWQCRAVAERIPGARYELLTGPGSSHALMLERADEFSALVLSFLQEHPPH